jgi:hypothetical protein
MTVFECCNTFDFPVFSCVPSGRMYKRLTFTQQTFAKHLLCARPRSGDFHQEQMSVVQCVTAVFPKSHSICVVRAVFGYNP